MDAREVKQLIGKAVEWEYAFDTNRGTCLVAGGVIEDVLDRNVLVSGDWKWLPAMRNLREVETLEQSVKIWPREG